MVWQTEHPRLMAIKKNTALEATPFTTKERQDADLITYVNTKFLYVEQSFKRTVNDMFVQTVYRRCLLHRDILKNRLIMAAVSPNAVATLVKNKLGYVSKVVGEVMYIMKCVPVPVEVRREKQCYVELPVTAYNKTFYMSPVTRILQDHAEQIQCNTIIPPMYFIDNRWIGFDPFPNLGIVPQELKVDSEEMPNFHSIKDLGAGGLYTYTEIRKAQDELLFNLERNALNNIIIRRVAGQDIQSQGFTTLSLFNKDEIKKLANHTIQTLYGYFTILGEWTSGLLGLYFIFRMIKFVIETFLNAIALHKINGFSPRLFASCWDTMTLFVLHHEQQKQENIRKDVAQAYFKNEDPADSLNQATAPVEKHVSFLVENEQNKPESELTTTANRLESFANLRKDLAKLPKINFTVFDKAESLKL